MALCSVDYVRSKIFSKTLTDSDIQDIITETSEDILSLCETTDESNPLVILAGKYAIRAAVLAKMKTTGELAASIKAGNSQRQNTADLDIERLEKKADIFIEKYRGVRGTTFTSPSFSVGFSNHHGGHHGFN
jgi:hypothetical protein